MNIVLYFAEKAVFYFNNKLETIFLQCHNNNNNSKNNKKIE
jgi:hypothetical protein